ncbi:MAG: nucleotidyltransferase domain-containing protein [Candidatus Aenigmatarchaeota archaeon]
MKHFDLMIKFSKESEKYFKNYRKYIKEIKKIAKKELKDVKVFCFGSVVEKMNLPSSDVDVLIVSKNMPKKISDRSKIKVKIWKKIGIFSPFELHLVTPKEFEWYKAFIKKLEAF